MINDLADFHEETVIFNQEKDAKMKVLKFNPKSMDFEVKRVYK